MKVALDERSQELDKIYELLNEAENLKLEKEL